jgi:hypothetical protein
LGSWPSRKDGVKPCIAFEVSQSGQSRLTTN